jgi:aconitate hydratase
VTATGANDAEMRFEALVRIDTPAELEYYRNGGILPYVLRLVTKTATVNV